MVPLVFQIALALSSSLVAQNARAPTLVRSFSPVSTKEENAQKSSILRIRTFRETDMHDVSDILSIALVDPLGETDFGLNFKSKFALLRTKHGVESMLLSRVDAIEMGSRISEECPAGLLESDKLRFLWSNDSFRNKIEKAALTSTEPHAWKGKNYNFACAPESHCWLQHKMMTAENPETGEILGFCELAMLSLPSEDGRIDDCSLDVAPTVVNLAISPKYRRQGIASRLMKTAGRFVRDQWASKELNLYVNKENDAAVTMYKNLGFEEKVEVEFKSRPQWYMTKQLSSVAEILYA